MCLMEIRFKCVCIFERRLNSPTKIRCIVPQLYFLRYFFKKIIQMPSLGSALYTVCDKNVLFTHTDHRGKT